MRRVRKASVFVALSLLLLFGGKGGPSLSTIDLAVAPYRYNLIVWELSNLPDKWLHKIWSFIPWNSKSHQEKLQELQEFFLIGQDIQNIERELTIPPQGVSLESIESNSPSTSNPVITEEDHLNQLDSLRSRRSKIRVGVEEFLESEVSAVLAEEGFSSRIGLIFPPVDVALTNPPRVLVLSPRDKIDRLRTVLLKANMKTEDMDALEQLILDERNLAALVAGTGGIATYPTIVRQDSSLLHVAETTVHEWLHTYWFFRPLGWNFWSSPEMTTLNETAATIAGRELGDRVYEALTGEKAPERLDSTTLAAEESLIPIQTEEEKTRFDFSFEMRKTRIRVDELLTMEDVEGAERYMEERRIFFGDNGFPIRKLNQAYFAFHGTYATNPASISPIGDEAKQLRSMTDSAGDFIRTMADFGSYQEFREFIGVPSAPYVPGPQTNTVLRPLHD